MPENLRKVINYIFNDVCTDVFIDFFFFFFFVELLDFFFHIRWCTNS